MAFEDLSTYTEVDSGSDITVSASAATFSTMEQQADSYVYKDYGANYFDDFHVDFEAEITFSESNGGGDNAQAVLCCFSNIIGNWLDFDNANDGIFIDVYYDGSNLITRIFDKNTDEFDFYSWGAVTTHTLTYFRFERIGSTATLKLYSDSIRTTLIDTLSIPCETGDKQYLYALSSRGTPGNTAAITGYSQNFLLNSLILTTTLGLSDEIDAFNLSDGFSEGIGFSDAIDAFNTSGYLDEGLGIDDAVDALKEIQAAISEGFGLSDGIDASGEFYPSVDDILGFNDEIDAFNWSAWIRQNAHLQVTRFIFTLTGDADGVADAEIKISSFNARKRTGEATYLSVVVPSYNYSAQISARANGEMVIEMAYEVDGAIVLREEILRATLETIRPDQGPLNRSITLTGHKTDSYLPQLVTLEKPTYYSLQSEKKVYRFLTIDPYLNPGDTCQVASDSFAVDNVIYYMGRGFSQMEVRE